jgi:hypothetical protein
MVPGARVTGVNSAACSLNPAKTNVISPVTTIIGNCLNMGMEHTLNSQIWQKAVFLICTNTYTTM